MNPLRKMFKTDKDVEQSGVVVRYAEGVEIKIARAGGSNTRFAQMLQKLTKPHRRLIQTETIDDKVLAEIMYETYAKTVVLGWAGVTKDVVSGDSSDADKELPFNTSNCVAVFRALPDLFTDIVNMSQQISLFREMEREADSGN